jgi:hypothetical protein
MKHRSKLSPAQQQQHAVESQTQSASAREFATAEELLRHDAARTPVPPGIAQRLQKSAGDLPRPKRSWWRRWFGR